MLIKVFMIIKGLTRLRPLDLFQFRPHGRSMRGHPLTQVKPSAKKAARAGFLTVTVITPWNKVPSWVVMAPNLDSFEAHLDDALRTLEGHSGSVLPVNRDPPAQYPIRLKMALNHLSNTRLGRAWYLLNSPRAGHPKLRSNP